MSNIMDDSRPISLPHFETLPLDYSLNKFLQVIAQNLTDEDLDALKYLLAGDGGFGKRTREMVTTSLQLFDLLKQKRYLDRNNIIYLQSFLFNIGRKDLAKKCAEYGKRKNKLHFVLPPQQPDEDCEFVQCHIVASLDNFQTPELEQIRHTIANLLDCPPHVVFVVGLEHTNSLLLTLMVPKGYAEKLFSVSKTELSFLNSVHVDWIGVKGQKKEVPCLGAHVEEIRSIMESNKDLNEKNDHLQAEYIKLKNEYEKLHSEAHRLMEKEMVEPGTVPKDLSVYIPTSVHPSVSPPPYSLIEPQLSPILHSAHQTHRIPEELCHSSPYRSSKAPQMGDFTPSNELQTQFSHERGSDEVPDSSVSYTNCIKLSHLPENVDEMTLRNFLEDRRDKGGGPVSNVNLEEIKYGIAYVAFTESAAVQRILQNSPILFEDHYIEIHALKPQDKSYMDFQEIITETELSSLQKPSIIEVRDFHPSTVVSTLEDYFESGKSGGGPDSIVTPIRIEKDVAYVTFKDPSVAERVLSKSMHKVDGAVLEVKKPTMHVSQIYYRDRIFVKNINPQSTEDGLNNVLSNRTKTEVTGIKYGEDLTSAMVFFEEEIDIEYLQKACRSKAYDGHYFTVESVPVTCCILVNNVADCTTDDGLKLHFQYKAQGGKILNIVRNLEERNCIIHFKNPDVVQSVLGKVHHLDGVSLSVEMFYDCLGLTSIEENAKFHNPDPYDFEPSSPVKIHFIERSEEARKELEAELRSSHAKMTIVGDGDSPHIFIESMLTPKTKSCLSLARKWQRSTEKILHWFFDKIHVKQHCTLKDVWKEMDRELVEMEKKEGSRAVIIRDHAFNSVFVVGWKEDVKSLYKEIDRISLHLSETVSKNASLIEETLSLKSIEFKMLDHGKEAEKIKSMFKDIEIEVDEEKKLVHLKGEPLEVYKGKAALGETLRSRVSVPVGEFSQHRIDFLNLEHVAQYIQEKLLEKGLDVIIEYGNNGHVMVYARSETEAIDAAHFLKEAVVETPRKLCELSDKLLKSQKLLNKIHELQKKYDGMVTIIPIPEDYSVLSLVVATDRAGCVLEEIEEFFTGNAITSESLPLPLAALRFLHKNKNEELQSLKKDLEDYHVEIECTDCELNVSGSEKGMHLAQERIIAMIKEIEYQTFLLKKPNIVKHLQTNSGELRVEKVEKSKCCIMDIYREEAVQIMQNIQNIGSSCISVAKQGQSEVYAECEMGGRKIMATLNDICEIDTDVIVNSADSGLKLEGGLARAIANKGGPALQKECADYMMKRRKKMCNGDVFLSTAGDLRFKGVIHAVGPPWQGGDFKEECHLREAIICSLEKCDEKEFRSVAIPAISTGVFNYPLDKATLVIAEAVKDYFTKENPSSIVREVHFCNIKRSIVEAFSIAMQSTFTDVTVIKNASKSLWIQRFKPPKCMLRSISDFGILGRLPETGIVNEIKLICFGENKDKLLESIKLLKDDIEEDYITKDDIEDDAIKEFNEEEIAKLNALAKRYGVECEHRRRVGRIKMYGLPQDIVDIESEIYKLIKQTTINRQTDRDAEYFSRTVQWYYVGSENEKTDFDLKMNMKLEKHFRSCDIKVAVESNQEKYDIDYGNMTISGSPFTRQQKLVRRIKSQDTSVPYPQCWTQIESNLGVFMLNSTTEEYKEVEKNLRMTAKSFPKVKKIERIQNKMLWEQYSAMKEGMSNSCPRGQLERKLWHGTTLEAVDGINTNGFNSRYCGTNTKAMLYGQGVYFAVNASTSMKDTYSRPDQLDQKRMYFCRVLTGKFTKGSEGITIPPQKYNNEYYDSVADDTENPTMFVIFRDSQAYPEYLITFQ